MYFFLFFAPAVHCAPHAKRGKTRTCILRCCGAAAWWWWLLWLWWWWVGLGEAGPLLGAGE